MSFEPSQFRRIIEDALAHLGAEATTPEAVELLMLTAAHETYLGRYLYQINLRPVAGGACGVFQMEPKTHDDVQLRLIVKKGRWTWMPLATADRMVWDLRYAIWLARIYYMQFPEPIPEAGRVAAMAKYYKKYWNTAEGKARIPNVIYNYNRYVRQVA